ncbi:MAG: response regulator, partial [Bacteroidota bacterium]
MQVLIIEDEALAAERLANLVYRYDATIEIMGPAPSVQAGITILEGEQKPDLILADIHLSDGRSFDIFTQVPIDCPVIFVTSYDEYALEAFSVMSIDYLLK